MPFRGKLSPARQLLSRPARQPAGTTQSVAYELGKIFQLDQDTCLLLASLDEQGGGDKCVGNDAFVFRTLDEIKPERAIPFNRPDPAYPLKLGQKGWLAKYPVSGGFVPLGARLVDGSPHPGAGTGLMVCGCATFNAAGDSIVPGYEGVNEFLQLRWDGRKLSVTAELHEMLLGFHQQDVPLSPFLADEAALLAPITTNSGIVVYRFEFRAGAWIATDHGEPFLTKKTTGSADVFHWTEAECSIVKADEIYWVYTRGAEPIGRLYRSADGLNYRLAFEHPAHTVPQALNQGLDGGLYLATNPFPGTDGGWLRNPLVIRPFEGDHFGEPIIAHDVDGVRVHGDQIPFVDHAVASNVFLERRWRHLLLYRVCDLKERTPYSFQEDLKKLLGKPRARSEKSGLYVIEIEYEQPASRRYNWVRSGASP